MFGSSLQTAYNGTYNNAYRPDTKYQAYLQQQQQYQNYLQQQQQHYNQFAQNRSVPPYYTTSGPQPLEEHNTEPTTITHLLYIDSREQVCEDAYKLSRGLPFIHVMDVNHIESSQVPECVTHLPAIVITQGQGTCYKGSRCEQYIKQLLAHQTKPKNKQEFVDTSQIDYQAFKIDPQYGKKGCNKKGMNDVSVQNRDTFGLGVYQNWPKFSRDPVKAKQQSELFLRKLKQDMQRRNIKAEKPIDDK